MSDPIFKVEIKNPPDLQKVADIKGMLKAVILAMATENELTVAHIVEQYVSRPQDQPVSMDGLRTISGRLRAAYRASAPQLSGDNITSSIGNNVVYARIHELGGKTRAHDIVARNAKALAFAPNGGAFKFFTASDFTAALKGTRGKAARAAKFDLFVDQNGIIFRRKVHHPGSNIPARRPIQRGIEDRLPQYAIAMGEAASKFANS